MIVLATQELSRLTSNLEACMTRLDAAIKRMDAASDKMDAAVCEMQSERETLNHYKQLSSLLYAELKRASEFASISAPAAAARPSVSGSGGSGGSGDAAIASTSTSPGPVIDVNSIVSSAIRGENTDLLSKMQAIFSNFTAKQPDLIPATVNPSPPTGAVTAPSTPVAADSSSIAITAASALVDIESDEKFTPAAVEIKDDRNTEQLWQFQSRIDELESQLSASQRANRSTELELRHARAERDEVTQRKRHESWVTAGVGALAGGAMIGLIWLFTARSNPPPPK